MPSARRSICPRPISSSSRESAAQWRLPEWLALFTEDAKYEVPRTDLPADASSATSLFHVADDLKQAATACANSK
jgi:hypothetical protein